MTMLVNLDEAKQHLRVTHSVDDDDIMLKLEVASAIVLTHLKTTATIDSNGNVDLTLLPPEARIATLLLLDTLYRDRGSGDEWVDRNYLPRAVAAVLYPHRSPTVA